MSPAPLNGHADLSASGPEPKLVQHLQQRYAAAGQSHVFNFFPRLSPSDQSSLCAQLASIDVDRVNRIYTNAVAADTPQPDPVPYEDSLSAPNLLGRDRTPTPQPEELLPLPDSACASIVGNPSEEVQWRRIGLHAIAENKVAVLLMAGGQGTRLGSSKPKGMYDIGLPSGMSLFEYQAGRIRRLQRVAEMECGKSDGSVRIRWYVMTSGPTKGETVAYFEGKGYFGLKPENVVFFEQGESVL